MTAPTARRADVAGLGFFWRPVQVGVKPVVRVEPCPGNLFIQSLDRYVVVECPVYVSLPALHVHAGRSPYSPRSLAFTLSLGVRERVGEGERYARLALHVEWDRWLIPYHVAAPDRSSAWTGIGWRRRYRWPLRAWIERAD